MISRLDETDEEYRTRVEKWDRRFLEMAKLVSGWSKDPSTQTGAVITDWDNRVVSVGYNGLPMGVKDTPERLNNREIKYATIVHCERNAIIFAKQELTGYTLYTWPFMSCSVCAAMVIQAGISRCVAPVNNNPRWVDSFKLTQELFQEANVELVLYDGYFSE
jgi:dCMP deaminase